MAEVTGVTFDHFETVTNAGVVDADYVDGALVLTKQDGSTVDIGDVADAVPTATTAAPGKVELATDAEVQAGSDGVRVVTPAALASLIASATARGLVELATNAEAVTGTDTVRAVTPAALANVLTAYVAGLDVDITTIAGLSPANNDVIQRKSGAWTNRTMTQLVQDILGEGELPEIYLHNGTSYVDADGNNIYIGPSDPGSVANGSIWFDTTGA